MFLLCFAHFLPPFVHLVDLLHTHLMADRKFMVFVLDPLLLVPPMRSAGLLHIDHLIFRTVDEEDLGHLFGRRKGFWNEWIGQITTQTDDAFDLLTLSEHQCLTEHASLAESKEPDLAGGRGIAFDEFFEQLFESVQCLQCLWNICFESLFLGIERKPCMPAKRKVDRRTQAEQGAVAAQGTSQARKIVFVAAISMEQNKNAFVPGSFIVSVFNVLHWFSGHSG